jgi:hypothetical protein
VDPVATPAAVQNVIPFDGPTGERVLIIGHGFGDVPVAVTSEGVDCTVEAWSPTMILAELPDRGSIAQVDLTLALPGGDVAFDIRVAPGAAAYPLLEEVLPPAMELGAGTIQLTGTGFGNGMGGLVLVEGAVIPQQTWSDTEITLLSPSQSVDGWAVVVNRDRASNSMPLAFMRRPEITAVVPDEGVVGESVAILGRFFSTRKPGDRVMLGPVELNVLNWADDLINVALSPGASNGDIVVEKKLVSNGVPFTVIPPTPGPPDGEQF